MTKRKKAEPERPIIWLVRRPEGFAAATAFDREQMERYKIGSMVSCTLAQPKDPKHTRRYFLLTDIVAKGLGREPDSLRRELKLRLGYIGEAIEISGITYIEPRSISSMEGPEFFEFYERLVEFITTELLPGADVQEILDRNYEFEMPDVP